MKKKHCGRVEYLFAKNAGSNGSSIIHNLIPVLLTDIFKTIAEVGTAYMQRLNNGGLVSEWHLDNGFWKQFR